MNSFNDKVVLVTGATGLICSNLVFDLLSNTSARIIAVGRSIEKLNDIFSKCDKDRICMIAQDVSIPLSIEESVDYIFHGAGPIDSKTIKEHPYAVISPNIIGLLNCYELAKKQKANGINCKVVVFSSATVYANRTSDDVLVTEDDTYIAEKIDSANSCYSESKRIAEVISNAMAKEMNIDTVRVRFSYVFGNTYFKPNTAFYQFVNTAMSGESISMNNSGLPRRDNIYVDDAVSGLETVALKGVSGEVYNISTNEFGGNFASIDEIANVIIECSNRINGFDSKLTYKQMASDKRLPGIILDNKRLRELGWEPKVSLFDGVERIITQIKAEE